MMEASENEGWGCRRTRRGWRLSQFGTVLSEVLLTPGPTHSVFDVLAALTCVAPRQREVALLGFGGGSMVAALRGAGCGARVHGVDANPSGYELLKQERCEWRRPMTWSCGDAVGWLSKAGRFDVIVDDLSMAMNRTVVKPRESWEVLPARMHGHLRSGGWAIMNLLKPLDESWASGLDKVTRPFASACVVTLAEFENRIVVAAERVGGARWLGRRVREVLSRLGSRQRDRIRVVCWKGE